MSEAAPVPAETPRAEKSRHAKVMEYALNLALKDNQLDASQVEILFGLFEETEAQNPNDSFENKLSKFEKSLKSRFGPRASKIYEIVCEKRKLTIQFIQQRQQKREGGDNMTNSQGSLPSQLSQPNQPPQLQQLQQQPLHLIPPQNNNNGGHYMSPSPPTLLIPQQQQHQQQQQQQQPHWQMQTTQSYYQSQEPQQPPGGNLLYPSAAPMMGMNNMNPVGGNNNGPMFNNNLLLQAMQPRPDMQHPNAYHAPPQQPQHHHQQQQPSVQQRQQHQQQMQQHQQQQQQLHQAQLIQQQQKLKQQSQAPQKHQQQKTGSGVNPGHNSNSGSNPPGELTAAEEIAQETERVNIQSEGMEYSTEKSITSHLLPNEFIKDERNLQRQAIRTSVNEQPVGTSVAAYGVRHVNQTMSVDLTGGSEISHGQPLEPGQEWQVLNILDKQMVTAIGKRILGSGPEDMKMSVEAQTLLSQGVQQYLKNMVELAIKTSKSRTNRASHNSYEGLSKMLIEHGKGYPLPENQFNIGMKWGPDTREILLREELEARKIVKEYNAKEEESLRDDMKAYDEERARLLQNSNKRKAENEPVWWVQDDTAEKNGTLSFEELSRVHFKVKVAQKYQLGMHQPNIRKKLPKAFQKSEQSTPQQTSTSSSKITEEDEDKTNGEHVSEEVAQAQSTTSVLNWANQPCPLKAIQRNLISVEDVEHIITHSSFAKSAVAGIGSSSSRDREGVGRHIQRWRLGLDLHQLI